MQEKTSFGKFIAKKRKDNDLTQKEFAEKLYVTESAVSKWERGISYPDITLVTGICETLGISEHELITASDDIRQREIEGQAKKFRNIITAYSWTFYLAYGLTLIICLICNLAVLHTLSWFFIVLTALMTAFSLTSLPLMLKKNKALLTLCAFFVSLNLLLFVCCIYTGGNWFLMSFVSLLFGFAVIFLPFVFRGIKLPQPLRSHKTLLCFAADTVLLFVLVGMGCVYENCSDVFFTVACPVTLFTLIMPWFIMITVRYIKANALFRTSICLFAGGIYMFFVNSILSVIIDGKPFVLPVFNAALWNDQYIQGNIILLITAVCIVLATAFCIGGIAIHVKRQKP